MTYMTKLRPHDLFCNISVIDLIVGYNVHTRFRQGKFYEIVLRTCSEKKLYIKMIKVILWNKLISILMFLLTHSKTDFCTLHYYYLC